MILRKSESFPARMTMQAKLIFFSLGARLEDYMFEKLDRQTPLRPSNSFLLGQTMAYAGREIGPGIDYGRHYCFSNLTCKS